MAWLLLIALMGSLDQAALAQPSPEEVQRQARDQRQADEENSKNPCLRKREGYWEHIGYRNCLEFGPKQNMRGVWYVGIEESGFVPNANSVPLVRTIDQVMLDTFLDADSVEKDVVRLAGRPNRDHCTRVYRLEFIGRRAQHPIESFWGKETQIIVADQIVSARYLGRIKTIGGSYERECTGPEKLNQ